MLKRIAVVAMIGAVLALSACSTVTMREKGTQRLASEPTYEASKSFFFWGLAGEHHVDAKQVCGGKSAKQIQAQDTFLDGFLGAITLGIYQPRSVKIWCN